MTEIDNNLPRGAAVLTDRVVPARAPWSGHVRQGDILRLIDLEGQQAIDFLCYNADDPEERYHAPNTIKIPANVYLNTGSVLYSVHARAMMTIVADTCGNHDTIFGCCSFALDKVRYGQTNSECCQRTFERELAKHGLGAKDVVPNVNFFMDVPIRSGGNVSIEEGQSRPGDHVDLRADMDVLVILSNCPEALNAATGSEPTPIRVVVYRPRGS
jgi:hypothetical protein